jgi:peptidyl-prolyl cis-trans isomerase SurA
MPLAAIFLLINKRLTMTMKRLLLLPLLLLLGVLHTADAADAAASAPAAIEEIDGIAAVVDDDVITRAELERRLQTITQQLRQKGTQLPPQAVLQRQMLERMILEQLQLAQAKQLGVTVDDEELNKVIDRIAEQNKLTLLQFREALQGEGISFATFREEIRKEVIITRLRNNQVAKRIDVSPQEIDNLLEEQRRDQSKNEEYHLQHILINLPADASPEQIAASRNKMNQLMKELRGGADFSTIAISHSAGPQALEGGDIGWRRQAQLPVAFAEAVKGLNAGEISKPVRSTSGYHLLKLLEKRGDQRHLVRQVNARHVLIATSALISNQEAKQRLERLRERILNGEDFAELARAHSDDTGSAAKGGELGWADPSIYVESFRDAISNSQPGEITAPFKSQFGWHILQVREWRDHDNTEEVERNQAFEALRERKTTEETENWLRSLRDEAYIDIRLD